MQKRIYQQQKQASAEEKAKPPEGYGTLHAQNEVVSAGVLPKPAGPIEKVRAHPLPERRRERARATGRRGERALKMVDGHRAVRRDE